MLQKSPLRNPYIAGKALGDERGFFGRDAVLHFVETALASPDNNAVVLFGQRRIGKTSILLQLRRRLPSPPFFPVYFDLMDRARRPLGAVLHELAASVAAEVGLPRPNPAEFEASIEHFQAAFLPSLYAALGENARPVFLFDEFDVLDVAAEEQLPPTAAARTFFPYLRQMMGSEPRLAFVFVVGRKAEELSIDFKAIFKATLAQRISVLDEDGARKLVRLAEREGSLRFSEAAVDRLLGLTARHPYFAQLMCQLLFDRAYADSPTETPMIEPPEVDAVAPLALERGENVFEWIWDGLPPAERIIFSAVAGATDENGAISEDQLMAVLQGHGIRILIRELELAPKTLVDWEMLRQADGGYAFFIELMRRWVVECKPLPKVKDELDRVNPIADQHYQLGHSYYRQGQLPDAVTSLNSALQVNPNHLKARLLLGETLMAQGEVGEAVSQLEEAYRYDPDAARYPLVRALLAQGEEAEKAGLEDDAVRTYRRALEISPRETVPRERLQTICLARGDRALAAGDLDLALAAYREVKAEDRVAEVEALRRRQALESLLTEVEPLRRREEWDRAVEIYTRLIEADPDDPRWRAELALLEKERDLARRYAEGLGARQQRKWAEAQRALADVVYQRPDYKDTAAQLAAVNQAAAADQAEKSGARAQSATPNDASFRREYVWRAGADEAGPAEVRSEGASNDLSGPVAGLYLLLGFMSGGLLFGLVTQSMNGAIFGGILGVVMATGLVVRNWTREDRQVRTSESVARYTHHRPQPDPLSPPSERWRRDQ